MNSVSQCTSEGGREDLSDLWSGWWTAEHGGSGHDHSESHRWKKWPHFYTPQQQWQERSTATGVWDTTQHVMVSACILKGKLWTLWDFRKDTVFSLSFRTDLDLQKSFVLTVWLILLHLSFRLTLMLIKSCSPLSPCLVWKTRISPSLSTVIWGCWNGGYRAQMSPSFL